MRSRKELKRQKRLREKQDLELKKTLEREVEQERRRLAKMEKRDRRLRAAAESENRQMRERARKRLEQKKASEERFAKYEADLERRQQERKQRAVAKELELRMKRQRVKAERERMKVEAQERGELDRVLEEKALERAEATRQQRLFEQMKASALHSSDAVTMELRRREAEAADRKRAELQAKIERNERQRKLQEKQRRLLRLKMAEKRESSSETAERVRSAAAAAKRRLIKEQERKYSLIERKYELREALRRERQQVQKMLRIRRDHWKEHTRREALETPGPGSYGDETDSRGQPAVSPSARRAAAAAGWSRAPKVTIMGQAALEGAMLPGPSRVRPRDVRPSGGRISAAVVPGISSTAESHAAAVPGVADYAVAEAEEEAREREDAAVSAYAHEDKRDFDMIESRTLRMQPAATMTVKNKLLALNAPKRSSRVILAWAKLRVALRAYAKFVVRLNASRRERESADEDDESLRFGKGGAASPATEGQGEGAPELDRESFQAESASPSSRGFDPSPLTSPDRPTASHAPTLVIPPETEAGGSVIDPPTTGEPAALDGGATPAVEETDTGPDEDSVGATKEREGVRAAAVAAAEEDAGAASEARDETGAEEKEEEGAPVVRADGQAETTPPAEEQEAVGTATEVEGTATEVKGTATEAAGTATEVEGTSTGAADTATEGEGTSTGAADTATDGEGTSTGAADTATEVEGTATGAADTATDAVEETGAAVQSPAAEAAVGSGVATDGMTG